MGHFEKRSARGVKEQFRAPNFELRAWNLEQKRSSKIFSLRLWPRRAVWFLALAVFVFLIGPSGAGQNDVLTIGAAAVAFDLKTLDGEPLRLEKFKGKVLLMNFFASWCDPCREEMPLINALASKASEKGYAVLGIAMQDRRASVMEFARETKIAFPLALDLDSKVQRAYRVFGPPATFFVDGMGVLRDVVLGPLTQERADAALKKTGARK